MVLDRTLEIQFAVELGEVAQLGLEVLKLGTNRLVQVLVIVLQAVALDAQFARGLEHALRERVGSIVNIRADNGNIQFAFAQRSHKLRQFLLGALGLNSTALADRTLDARPSNRPGRFGNLIKRQLLKGFHETDDLEPARSGLLSASHRKG